MSRASGTTTSAPRPPSTQAATACAIASGHRSPAAPGSADHTARGAPPAVTCWRKAAPPRYGAHAVADGDGGLAGPAAPSGASASTRACRAGTARRSTSFSVPAQRSATARASRATCGVSTGSAETTLRTGSERAVVLGLVDALQHVAVDVLRTEPHLDPGARARPCPREPPGTRYSNTRSRCAGRRSTHTRATGRCSASGTPADGRAGRAASAAAGPRASAARRPRSRPRAHQTIRRPRGPAATAQRQPTADWRSATRSVRSQVNSGSSRPKCP